MLNARLLSSADPLMTMIIIASHLFYWLFIFSSWIGDGGGCFGEEKKATKKMEWSHLRGIIETQKNENRIQTGEEKKKCYNIGLRWKK